MAVRLALRTCSGAAKPRQMRFFCWISNVIALEAKAEDACFMCQYKVVAGVVSLIGCGHMLRLV